MYSNIFEDSVDEKLQNGTIINIADDFDYQTCIIYAFKYDISTTNCINYIDVLKTKNELLCDILTYEDTNHICYGICYYVFDVKNY